MFHLFRTYQQLPAVRHCPGMEIFKGRLSQASRELLIRRGDGSESWVETSAAAIADSEGKVTHIVTVIEDIGERKRFSDEVLRSKKPCLPWAHLLQNWRTKSKIL